MQRTRGLLLAALLVSMVALDMVLVLAALVLQGLLPSLALLGRTKHLSVGGRPVLDLDHDDLDGSLVYVKNDAVVANTEPVKRRAHEPNHVTERVLGRLVKLGEYPSADRRLEAIPLAGGEA